MVKIVRQIICENIAKCNNKICDCNVSCWQVYNFEVCDVLENYSCQCVVVPESLGQRVVLIFTGHVHELIEPWKWDCNAVTKRPSTSYALTPRNVLEDHDLSYTAAKTYILAWVQFAELDQSASYFFIIYFNVHAKAFTWSLSIFHEKIFYEFIIFLHASSKYPLQILLMLECITGIIHDLHYYCIRTIFGRSVSNLKHLRDLVRWLLQELCKGKLYRERRRVHGSLIQRLSYHAARVNKYLGVLVCVGRQCSSLILTDYLQFMLMDTWYRDYKTTADRKCPR